MGHFIGSIDSKVARDADPRIQTSHFAHELHHANELGSYGAINKNVPGFRPNADHPDAGETAGAQQAEVDARNEAYASAGQGSLSPSDLYQIFQHSSDWDALSDEQRQECLSNVACLTLSSYGALGDPNPRR